MAPENAPAVGPLTPPAGWTVWSPTYAPHVIGAYEPVPVAQPVTGAVCQRWLVVCRVCGGHDEACCASGAVRLNIARFAGLHEHGRGF